MQPVIPFEARIAVQHRLEEFFASDDSQRAFALADSPGVKAALVADALCGRAAMSLAAVPARFGGTAGRRRVLLTGCFDLMHAGHYNALRQAKAAFHGEEIHLVAGVHGDDAIMRAKGAPTVLNHAERVEIVEACRWVDEVAGDLDYAVPASLLDRLGCECAVHGDDLPQVTDGTGLFDELQMAGRLHIVKRTEGTSTTALIGRLMSMSKEHLQKRGAEEIVTNPTLASEEAALASPKVQPSAAASAEAPMWMLLPTMSRMSLFFGDRPAKLGAAARVVYVPGEWDLFHVGHVRFLAQARKLGDFILVGCHDDSTIHSRKGLNYPLQTLHERALNVLACKHADDVILSASWRVTQDMITSMNISVVATGRNNVFAEGASVAGFGDPFEVPRALGILQIIESDCTLTMDVIAERIVEHTTTYTLRQLKKEKAEREYSEQKEFVAEA